MKTGDVVMVLNSTAGGKVIEEGKAKLVKPTGIEGQWYVEFLEEPGAQYPRFVSAERKVK